MKSQVASNKAEANGKSQVNDKSEENDKSEAPPKSEALRRSDQTSDSNKPPDDEEVNLLNALKTAFSTNSNPEAFLSRAAAQISDVEAAIVDTCSKNRLRIDENLYALLESRDAIAEQTAELEKSTHTASHVTNAVSAAVDRLTEKIHVRKNLDAALTIAAQTRKLTRMYARIEDTIDARRLYTAFRMLKVLEEETRCVQPGTVLQELVPDTHRLREQITLHARKAFHAWLPAVRKFEHALGAYALHHATVQALSHRMLLESSRMGAINDAFLIPASPLSQTALQASVGKPWTPLLTTQSAPPQFLVNRRSARPLSAQRVGLPPKSPFAVETNVRPDIGADARRSFRSLPEYRDDVPKLFLRPLLQSVLVNDGLGLLGDMRGDYRRERHAHLQRLLEEGDSVNEAPSSPDMSVPPSLASSKARQTETVVFKVCGFFVVERAVEIHASAELLQRTVVDNEWWPLAYSRLRTLLRELDGASLESSPDKAMVQGLEENLTRFAQVNDLSA